MCRRAPKLFLCEYVQERNQKHCFVCVHGCRSALRLRNAYAAEDGWSSWPANPYTGHWLDGRAPKVSLSSIIGACSIDCEIQQIPDSHSIRCHSVAFLHFDKMCVWLCLPSLARRLAWPRPGMCHTVHTTFNTVQIRVKFDHIIRIRRMTHPWPRPYNNAVCNNAMCRKL